MEGSPLINKSEPLMRNQINGNSKVSGFVVHAKNLVMIKNILPTQTSQKLKLFLFLFQTLMIDQHGNLLHQVVFQ